MLEAHCTVPYFGFKAKLDADDYFRGTDCTVPYFGFKAKPISHQHGR